MYFSVIIPTHARTNEVSELLFSLVNQHHNDFEVIIADNSLDDSVQKVVEAFRDKLNLKYLYHKGLGVSASRNWGALHASGDYVIFFDSDCVIPPDYFTAVLKYLQHNRPDAFGGPDKAGEEFSRLQKAISYAMTSFFTTGGIRGRKKHAGQYQPRSYNMGIRKDVFDTLGGFADMDISEDIDLSIRLYKSGCKVGLIEEAFVYHKRRSTWVKFFKRIYSFGGGRIHLQKKHGNALKPVHLLPSFFVIYIMAGLLSVFFSVTVFSVWLLSLVLYLVLLIIDATFQYRDLITGLLSAYASLIMLTGYGLGMLKEGLRRCVVRRK